MNTRGLFLAFALSGMLWQAIKVLAGPHWFVLLMIFMCFCFAVAFGICDLIKRLTE